MPENSIPVDHSLNEMDRPNDHIDDNNFRRGWQAAVSAYCDWAVGLTDEEMLEKIAGEIWNWHSSRTCTFDQLKRSHPDLAKEYTNTAKSILTKKLTRDQ